MVWKYLTYLQESEPGASSNLTYSSVYKPIFFPMYSQSSPRYSLTVRWNTRQMYLHICFTTHLTNSSVSGIQLPQPSTQFWYWFKSSFSGFTVLFVHFLLMLFLKPIFSTTTGKPSSLCSWSYWMNA